MPEDDWRCAPSEEQIREEFLALLRERQRKWISATVEGRDSARQQFLDALQAFYEFTHSGLEGHANRGAADRYH